MGLESVARGAAHGAAGALRPEEKGAGKGEGPLKGRVSLSWIEVPTIAATVACILALVVSLIGGYNAAAVGFGFVGVGCLFSTFYIHRSIVLKVENAKYEAENKRHAELLTSQGKALKTLKGHNKKYGAENKKHEAENERQRAITGLLAAHRLKSKKEFEEFLVGLSNELGILKDETSDIGALAGVLQKFADDLNEKVNIETLAKHAGKLEVLQEEGGKQYKYLDELRIRFKNTFMEILQAARDEMISISPRGKSEQINAAFNRHEQQVDSFELPTPPPAIEVLG